MPTYSQIIKKPSANTMTLAWIEPSQELLLWSLVSGAIYKRSVSYWVIDIKDEGASLTKAASSSLSVGEWFFDENTYEVYVRRSDNSSPQSHITATYRMFYSDKPAYLPWDMSSGKVVHYDERISGVSEFNQEIDDELVGIALEGKGSITLINNDGYFDSLFDKLFWENKNVKIFTYSSDLDSISDAKIIFNGLINNKSFSSKYFKLSINDYISRLREQIPMSVFSSSDGDLDDSMIGKPKRKVYGKVDGLRVVSLDQTLDGYDLSGTISGTAATTTITGSGTSFLTELLQGDTMVINDESYTVDSIASNTSLTISDEIETGFSSYSAVVQPAVPYRNKNRTHLIAGHKLREPTTTISLPKEKNRFEVADISDIEAGDVLLINSEYRTVRRVSGSLVVLTQNLSSHPLLGDAVARSPVYNAYYNKKKLVVNRDYSVTNTTECKIVLTNTCEFNIADIKPLGTIGFTGSSRSITYAGDFNSVLKAGDWIRSDEIAHQTWYQISSITDEGNAKLVTAYGGTTGSKTCVKKQPEYIDDDSIISVDCSGMERSGTWVKTVPDIIKDILVNDLEISNVNTASFATANAPAFYTASLTLPNDYGGNAPKSKDVIDSLNSSIFGSLITNNSYEIAYSVLDTSNPSDTTIYTDHDIYGFSVKSKIDVSSKVIGSYRHFDVSRFTGESGASVYEFDNDFVNKNIGIVKEKSIDLYLYDSLYAETITQRYAFLWSLTRSTLEIDTNLLFSEKNLGDKIIVSLNRLFNRYGSSDRSKIGVIQSIKKSSTGTTIEVSDLGNMFNRCAGIAQNTTNDFGSASDTERLLYGFIVDNTLFVPDTSSETELGSNLIG